MLYKMIATCPEETKDVVTEELKALGMRDIVPSYMAVAFSATPEQFYQAHLRLGTVSHLLKVLRECSGTSAKILHEQAKRVEWTKVFAGTKTFKVDGIAGNRGAEFMTSNEISKQVRLAIEHEFTRKGMTPPQVDLKEPKVVVSVFVRNNRAVISVNTSGKTLHKRGYRLEGHPAPVKETLAAALLHMAGYTGQCPLLDPMCGSGTIAIEAAFLALNKAPNIHRKKGEFGFEHLADFDAKLWRRVQDDERAKRETDLGHPIFARDINATFVEQAKRNALRARVEKHLDFGVGSFFALPAPAANGIIVSNLPYGERIGAREEEELKVFYKTIGDTLKQHYAGWKACLLVNEESPWKFLGLKPARKIPILNGAIAAKLLIFELYTGSKKGLKREATTRVTPDS